MTIKKSTFTIVLIIVVIVLAVVAIVSTVFILNSRSVGVTKNNAQVIGNETVTFTPSTVTASSGQDFTVTINTIPKIDTLFQGYTIRLDFDKTKVQVKNINYLPTSGFSQSLISYVSDNSKLTEINGSGKLIFWGQNNDVGITLPGGESKDLIVLTFTSLGTDTSQVDLSTTGTSQFYPVIPETGEINQMDVVLSGPLNINPPVATTTPVPTTTVTSTTVVTTTTATDTTTPVPTTIATNTTTPVVTTTPAPTRAPNDTATPTPTPTKTSIPGNTTTVTTTAVVTPNNTIDTTLSSDQTVTTTKPTITGNNANADYAYIDDETTNKYTITPAADGKFSFKVTTALIAGIHNVKFYDVSGSVLGTTTFSVNTSLPDTGLLDEIIVPTLLSIGLIAVGLILMKKPILSRKK